MSRRPLLFLCLIRILSAQFALYSHIMSLLLVNLLRSKYGQCWMFQSFDCINGEETKEIGSLLFSLSIVVGNFGITFLKSWIQKLKVKVVEGALFFFRMLHFKTYYYHFYLSFAGKSQGSCRNHHSWSERMLFECSPVYSTFGLASADKVSNWGGALCGIRSGDWAIRQREYSQCFRPVAEICALPVPSAGWPWEGGTCAERSHCSGWGELKMFPMLLLEWWRNVKIKLPTTPRILPHPVFSFSEKGYFQFDLHM